MKFRVSSQALLSSLHIVGSTILSKNTMQILDNFLLTIEDGQLIITGSDMESTMVTTLPVEQEGNNFTIALPAKLLTSTLPQFNNQILEFNINEDNFAVHFSSEFGDYNFIGLSGEEYPEINDIQGESQKFDIDTDILLSGLSKVMFAMGTDELRPTFNGIYFDIKEENLTMVATNAHKLAKVQYSAIHPGFESAFILPRKPINLLKASLDPRTDSVQVQFDNTRIVFKAENFTLYTQQIEGNYPNYNRVIPQDNPYKVIIDRVSLVNALKRVGSFSNQGTSLVKFAISNNQILLTAQDIDFSTSAKEMLSCQYQGDDIEIGFKASVLIEVLTSAVYEEVVLELSSPTRPGLILPLQNLPDEELTLLLMPLLLGE